MRKDYYKIFSIICFIALLVETYFILVLTDEYLNAFVGTAIIVSSFVTALFLFLLVDSTSTEDKGGEVTNEADKIKEKSAN